MYSMKLSTLIDEKEIQEKILDIGQSLSKKFSGQKPLVVGVLKGSFMFYADLIRHLDTDIECDFCGVSSYGKSHKSSGECRMTMDIAQSVQGRDVIVVEDIVDTGLTMSFLQNHLKERGAKSVTLVTLLLKPDALKTECALDYVGFKIPNDFVVGFGLDYQGQFRNLPYIAQVQSMN